MRFRRVLALVLAAVALAASPAVAQPKEVVIGLLYPLSGPAAPAAVGEKRVFELFADMVNGVESMLPGAFYQGLKGLPRVGGGARLRLIFADHRGQPDLGQVEAERLITREKVQALVGARPSRLTATASQPADG